MSSWRIAFVTCGILIVAFTLFRGGEETVRPQGVAVRQVATDGDKQATSSAEPHFVGRKVCKECHPNNFALHAKHGHASTFHKVSDTDLVKRFAGTKFDAGDGYGTYEYQSDADGNLFVTLPSQFGDSPFPLQYVLGSGQHAKTILTLAPDENGGTQGIEHRVSWYPGARLGLTPGHETMKPGKPLELFGDSSDGQPLDRCIHCHTTSGKIVGEVVEDLIPSVNCEKCHGPGSDHVRLARLGPKPPPFSVGKESWDTESEIQLCGDCHRLPRSVTRKEIREYPDLLVRFQPIGMLQSRCYLDSDYELRCTTCHNPHQSLQAVEPTTHIKNCLKCHSEDNDQVVCPIDAKDGCIDCHMSSVTLRSGLRFHDHWIRVRNERVR